MKTNVELGDPKIMKYLAYSGIYRAIYKNKSDNIVYNGNELHLQ